MIRNPDTILINHLTGLGITRWQNTGDDIRKLDDQMNGFWLIKVPNETDYFLINPGDTIIFHSPNHCETHCAIAIFKDYCDKENRLIKVKSYFATPDPTC